MRWGDLDVTYARPLHWIAALFGNKVIPFQVGDILSDRFSFGHAQLSPKNLRLQAPQRLRQRAEKTLRPCRYRGAQSRASSSSSKTLEKKIKGHALESKSDPPGPQSCRVAPAHPCQLRSRLFRAPKEVLISEMVEHQKYFPVADSKGQPEKPLHHHCRQQAQRPDPPRQPESPLRAPFRRRLPLRAGSQDPARAVQRKAARDDLPERARHDARQSRAHRSDCRNAELHTSTSPTRKKSHVPPCSAKPTSLPPSSESSPNSRAPIGKYYALAQKEDKEVAEAIEEQWMPRAENAPLPQTGDGIATQPGRQARQPDRLLQRRTQTLLFERPLRPAPPVDRHAQNPHRTKESIDLKRVLEEACPAFPKLKANPCSSQPSSRKSSPSSQRAPNRSLRITALKKMRSMPPCKDSASTRTTSSAKQQALHAFRASGSEFAKLYEVYKRAKGQLEKPATASFNPALATEPAEKELGARPRHSAQSLEGNPRREKIPRGVPHDRQTAASPGPPLRQGQDPRRRPRAPG